MSDLTPTDPSPTPAPAGNGAFDFSPEQAQALREHWTSLGLNAAQFDRAAAGLPEPSAPDPVQTRQSGSRMADDGVMALVDGLRKAGVPEADIRAALDADGIALAPEDQRTDEQREYDDVWAGAAPSEYHVDYVGRLPAETDVRALAEFNAAATAWLSEVGFPVGTGPAVIETALDVGHLFASMTEPERALWTLEQKAVFERIAGGPETAAERITFAAKALAQGGAAFRDALHKAGALHDARVVSLLALQGERIGVREAL